MHLRVSYAHAHTNQSGTLTQSSVYVYERHINILMSVRVHGTLIRSYHSEHHTHILIPTGMKRTNGIQGNSI